MPETVYLLNDMDGNRIQGEAYATQLRKPDPAWGQGEECGGEGLSPGKYWGVSYPSQDRGQPGGSQGGGVGFDFRPVG